MLHDWVVALANAPWVYLALFALATIDGLFPPVPSESVVIALAALSVSAGTPNLALILLAAATGAFTGDQIAYAVGSRIDVRRLKILRNPRGQRTVDCAERALAQRGPSFILAARFVPIGRVAVNLTAGAVRYPRRRFVGLTALAAVMWSLYSVAIGLLAGAWIQDRPVVAIAVGVVGGVISGFLLDWGLSRRHAPHARVIERVDAGPPPIRQIGHRSLGALKPSCRSSPTSHQSTVRLHAAPTSLCICGLRDPEATSMADADDVRHLALALPHVVEIESDGFDFRVADRGFVWSYPERRQGKPRLIRTDIAVLFVGDEAEKQALLLGEPEVFFTTAGYDGSPLVMLRLDEVDVKRLGELVTDAWRMRAPDALVDRDIMATRGSPAASRSQPSAATQGGHPAGTDQG